MRQEHETAKSFNELKAITQAIMLKKDALKNATHQESEPTQETNAQASDNKRLKTEQANNSSEQVFKPGFRHTPRKRGQR
ncbi:hypothetical protein ACOWLH_00040 [Helicobacter pylori]